MKYYAKQNSDTCYQYFSKVKSPYLWMQSNIIASWNAVKPEQNLKLKEKYRKLGRFVSFLQFTWFYKSYFI